MKSASGRYAIAIVLLTGLALRIGWAAKQGCSVDPRLPDQFEYLKLGENVSAGKGLTFHDDRFDQDIRAYRMPGYPLFVAACGASPRSIRFAQAIIDAATILAAYLLARRWLSAAWSAAAAAIVAFNPFLVYFTGLILSETLLTAMLMWGLVLLMNGERRLVWSIAGICTLALAVHVRPSVLLLPVAFAILIGPFRPIHRPIIRIALAACLSFIVLFPWALRNRLVLGEWIWLTTNGGITRYDGFQPQATGGGDQSFLSCPVFAQVRLMNEVQRDRHFSKLAGAEIHRRIRENPSQLLRLTAAKIARTWSPLPLSHDFGSRRLYVIAALAYSLPFDAMVIAGLLLGRSIRSGKVLLLLPAIYFTVVHALTVGSLRYRIPAEPPLAIIAGAGAAAILGRAGMKKEEVCAG